MAQSSARNQADSVIDLDVSALKAETVTRRGQPFAQYQYIDVEFNSTADANTEIRHALTAPDPEDIDFQVVRWNFSSAPATAPVVYRDSAANRRVWSDGYIVLRCNTASASCTLLLTVRR